MTLQCKPTVGLGNMEIAIIIDTANDIHSTRELDHGCRTSNSVIICNAIYI